ncbi:MAG: CarD family transcriptional regulator [Oscillospiraceae bacterium]|nr:CarD family transcriptional regulator [Oscillospiraceae bacterium]
MYSVNEKIHYGGSGVCVIQEIATMRFGRTREKYYVLKPVYQNSSVIYVPVENEALVSKMRPVLSREEVDRLIDGMPEIPTAWEEDPQARKASFDALLRSNECRSLIILIKTLHAQKKRRQADGKALHVSDETFLREAQRLLYDEFAGALEIQPTQVHAYIQSKLGQSA